MPFTPRMTVNSPTAMEGNKWWYSDGNVFYISDYGLPNCTCYAYGRYAEIMGKFYKLPTRNAQYWFDLATDFNRGQTPALGAIACWYGPGSSYSGHVGVVEQIYDNGDFICSYSGWGGPYFSVRTIKKSENYTFERANGYRYTCQGFIYGYETPGKPDDPSEPLPETKWHMKATGYYSRTSQEAFGNAVEIWKQMTGYGWSLSAICGLIGNVEAECSYNPWLWEGNKMLSSTDPALDTSKTNGYGLVQWTPPGEYCNDGPTKERTEYGPNFKDKAGKQTDPVNQLWAIQNRTTAQGQWIQKSGFRVTWNEYRVNQNTPEWSAECFVRDYERPAKDPATGELYHLARRKEAARYWYEKLLDYDPQEPETPPDEPPLPDPEPPTPKPDPVTPVKVKDVQWYAKHEGRYARNSPEAYQNAFCIFNRLFFEENWTVRAICGLLGNIEVESGYNPYYWGNDAAQPAFYPDIGPYGVVEVVNEDLDDTESGTRYGLLQWIPAGFFVHNTITETWWHAERTEYHFDWMDVSTAWSNWKNPVYTVWFFDGWHYIITGYEFVAPTEAGEIKDGDEQLTVLLQYPEYWNKHATLSFEAYQRSHGSAAWCAKMFAYWYCQRTGDVKQQMEAARYWYKIFRIYEPHALTVYTRRRQLLD